VGSFNKEEKCWMFFGKLSPRAFWELIVWRRILAYLMRPFGIWKLGLTVEKLLVVCG
jgi:hypothetical protein